MDDNPPAPPMPAATAGVAAPSANTDKMEQLHIADSATLLPVPQLPDLTDLTKSPIASEPATMSPMPNTTATQSMADSHALTHTDASPPALDMQSATSSAMAVHEKPTVHPEAAQIIRQVEFYLGDENLPGDAHLLARTGPTGDGWISVNEIFGFKKMRGYKPRALAKEALHMSEKLELNGKFVRRKDPLTVPLHVTPAINDDRVKSKMVIDKPWLTKGMLKPTGFEDGATDGPMKPEEYEAERKLFDPEQDFTIRIEYAVTRYLSKRKMHQKTANIFVKFLLFGGFEGGQKQFTGGFDEKAMEEYNSDEIMQMKAQFGVADRVLDGLLETDDNGKYDWSVDFEGMAKAFLSSEFFQRFDWTVEQVVIDTTSVLKNFYNYLLYHDVAPEYEDDILAAREVCNIAVKELPVLAAASRGLQGRFDKACSTLFYGSYAKLRVTDPTADWVHPDDDLGLSTKDAEQIFAVVAGAHLPDSDIEKMEQIGKDDLRGTNEHDTGLEVVSIDFGGERVDEVYQSDEYKGSWLDKPTGAMHCVHWDAPMQPPKDLSPARKAEVEALKSKKYEFFIEESVLRSCYPGMKFTATVMELENVGLMWIDHFDKIYPSFHTWTMNEFWRETKPIGPPDEWMVRQNGLDAERAGEGDVGENEVDEEHGDRDEANVGGVASEKDGAGEGDYNVGEVDVGTAKDEQTPG